MTLTRSTWLALIATWWATGVAHAADSVPARLTRAEADITALHTRADALDASVVPGKGFLSNRQAMRRFEEHLYEYMVGEYQPAAEGFFALVTTGALADAGLHRDAEWYLAESLYMLGNFDTAEARYRVVVDDREHPFHDDAVRRLLELYAASGQTERFREAYDREIVRGTVKASDLITYSVAKSFYKQKDYARAKSEFLSIPVESPLYAKARYFLGTVMVVEGDLEQAIAYFKEVPELSVDSMEDRELLDLSLLALARIHYEQGKFAESADYYGRIGGDSPYLADKLYENVWTFIKQEAYAEALRSVEIFLLAYPEHQYAAQLRLLEGQLHMKRGDHGLAIQTFDSVIKDYTPIRDRFAVLGAENHEAGTYFDQLVLFDGVSTPDPTVPPYALAMMISDPEIRKAIGVQREIERQEDNVSVSEQLVADIDGILDRGAGIGGYARMRADVGSLRGMLIQQRVGLLKTEEDWLWSSLSASERGDLEKFRKRRETLRDRTKGLESLQGGTGFIDDEVAVIRAGYFSARTRLKASDAGIADRLDKAHSSLDSLTKGFVGLESRINEYEKTELTRIRERLELEAGQVADQRRELSTTSSESDVIAVELTQAGFRRLHGFFSDSVLRADIGIVDVYWAQKLELASEREDLLLRKSALVDALEARYDRVREKLPPVSTGGGK